MQAHSPLTTTICTKIAKRLLSTGALGIIIVLSSCTFQQYNAQPIEQEATVSAIEKRTVDEPRFAEFLTLQMGKDITTPITAWDLPTLIHSAHYFHPDLNVARAQWKATQSSTLKAKQKPLVRVNGGIARSNRANGDINPFAYSFGIDLPIVTHDKQHIRIAEFDHLSNIAKLNVAQTAWLLRHAVTNTFIHLQDSKLQRAHQTKVIVLNQAIVDMLEKRLQYGEASGLEVSAAKRLLNASEAQLQSIIQHAFPLKATLAKNLGLPVSATQTMQFDFAHLLSTEHVTSPTLISQTTQKTALLNRLDVRTGLVQYAIAENKLKLEIAKQYPDITISPGLGYEFGDHVWSLGFSSLFTLLEKNKVGIAEAKQFRTVAVAKFEQIQTRAMAEASVANAQYAQAVQTVQVYQQKLAKEKENYQVTFRHFNAGILDRMDLTHAKMAILAAEKRLISAITQLNLAILNLENSLQTPLLTEHLYEK